MQEERDEGDEVRDLPAEVRARTPGAFDRLFARYRDYLHQVIRMRMDPGIRQRLDPSDIIQETHLEAVRQWADYLERRPMPPRLWLRHIACQKLLMARRRHGAAARRAVGREVALPERSSLQLAEQLLAGGSTPASYIVDAFTANLLPVSASMASACAIVSPSGSVPTKWPTWWPVALMASRTESRKPPVPLIVTLCHGVT